MAPRILFPFVGDVVGGSHLSALMLIEGLNARGFEPVILLHQQDGPLAGHLRQRGLPFLHLDAPILAPLYSRSHHDAGPTGYATRTLPRLIRCLHRERIDIVHSNDGRMHLTWALPARLSGRPLIWHHRGAPDASGVNRIAPFLASRILSVSHFSLPAKPIRSVAHKVEVLRSPFAFPRPRPAPDVARQMICREIAVPPDTALLGWFGLLNRRKRPDHFVRALAEIMRLARPRSVVGLIFGQPEHSADGLDENCRKIAADLGIAANLFFMGHRTPPENWMAGLDALLVTAVDEPFGRTLIEAMDLGIPVIATASGGNSEAIVPGETGFLVPVDDPSAFAEPMLRMLTEPGLADQVRARARIAVQSGFDTDRHIDRVCEIYASLLNRRGAEASNARA